MLCTYCSTAFPDEARPMSDSGDKGGRYLRLRKTFRDGHIRGSWTMLITDPVSSTHPSSLLLGPNIGPGCETAHQSTEETPTPVSFGFCVIRHFGWAQETFFFFPLRRLGSHFLIFTLSRFLAGRSTSPILQLIRRAC